MPLYMSCPECGLTLRAQPLIPIERCPRCIARRAREVRMVASQTLNRPAQPPAPRPGCEDPDLDSSASGDDEQRSVIARASQPV